MGAAAAENMDTVVPSCAELTVLDGACACPTPADFPSFRLVLLGTATTGPLNHLRYNPNDLHWNLHRCMLTPDVP